MKTKFLLSRHIWEFLLTKLGLPNYVSLEIERKVGARQNSCLNCDKLIIVLFISSLEAATLRTCLSTNPNFLMALPSAPENNRASLGYNMGSTYRKNPYVKFTFHSPRNGALTSKNVSSPSKKKTKTHSVNSGAYLQSVKQCLDPNFVQFVPAKYEFPDKKSLPQSMAHLSPDDEVVNFYPVTRKGRNYLKYCKGWLFDDGKPSNIAECVRKYTSDRNWYCTEVNLALASDSPRLFQYGPYIRELKYSISESRMNFRGTVFRGEFIQ